MEGKLGGAAAGGVAASLRGRPPSGHYWTFGFDERYRTFEGSTAAAIASDRHRPPMFVLTFSAGNLHYKEYDGVW
jgi:hypothetical protein